MKKIIKLLCLTLILTLLTGCAASEEIIGNTVQVHKLIDLEEIPVPEGAWSSTVEYEFPLNDLDILGEAFYGEQPYEVSSWALGFDLKCGTNILATYGDEKCQDGKWLGELKEATFVDYSTNEIHSTVHSVLRPRWINAGLVEQPTDDPLLRQWQTHSQEMMEKLNYENYELVHALGASREALDTILMFQELLNGDDESTLTPDVYYYYFTYRVAPDTKPSYPVEIVFIYNTKRLAKASLSAAATITSYKEEPILTAAEAYEEAVKKLPAGEYWLYSAQYDPHAWKRYSSDTKNIMHCTSQWVFDFYAYEELSGELAEFWAPAFERLGDAAKPNAYLDNINVTVDCSNGYVKINNLSSNYIPISKYTDPTGIWWPLEERGAE